jgi:hypothetical protein
VTVSHRGGKIYDPHKMKKNISSGEKKSHIRMSTKRPSTAPDKKSTSAYSKGLTYVLQVRHEPIPGFQDHNEFRNTPSSIPRWEVTEGGYRHVQKKRPSSSGLRERGNNSMLPHSRSGPVSSDYIRIKNANTLSEDSTEQNAQVLTLEDPMLMPTNASLYEYDTDNPVVPRARSPPVFRKMEARLAKMELSAKKRSIQKAADQREIRSSLLSQNSYSKILDFISDRLEEDTMHTSPSNLSVDEDVFSLLFRPLFMRMKRKMENSKNGSKRVRTATALECLDQFCMVCGVYKPIMQKLSGVLMEAIFMDDTSTPIVSDGSALHYEHRKTYFEVSVRVGVCFSRY